MKKVEKLCSEMQRSISGIARKNSELINGILLNFNNLRCQNSEMQAEKQQQEKIHDDLQRTLKEIQRRNEHLEHLHNNAQERNRDMLKANLTQEASAKELKEKLGETQHPVFSNEHRVER